MPPTQRKSTPNTQTAAMPRRRSVMRKAYTLFAILGAGLVAGALLGEASMMSFTLTMPSALEIRSSGTNGSVNGYLIPAYSRGQSRRTISQPRGPMAHHFGL